jgi:hypothetical protein
VTKRCVLGATAFVALKQRHELSSLLSCIPNPRACTCTQDQQCEASCGNEQPLRRLSSLRPDQNDCATRRPRASPDQSQRPQIPGELDALALALPLEPLSATAGKPSAPPNPRRGRAIEIGKATAAAAVTLCKALLEHQGDGAYFGHQVGWRVRGLPPCTSEQGGGRRDPRRPHRDPGASDGI